MNDGLPTEVSEANIIHAYLEVAVSLAVNLFSEKGTSSKDLFLKGMKSYSLPEGVDSDFVFDFMTKLSSTKYGRFFFYFGGEKVEYSFNIGNLRLKWMDVRDYRRIKHTLFIKTLFAIDRRIKWGYTLDDFFR